MIIRDIVFRERPAYQDMYIRPFGADATGDIIRRMCRDTEEGTNFSPSALAGTAGRIIRPVSQHRGRAIIANGWGERRFMFMMRVEVRKTQGIYTILEIVGSTDHADAVNGIRGIKLPEDMCLYFNSITEVEQVYIRAPGQGREGWRTRIGSSNHLIIPQTMPDYSRDRSTVGTVTLRPHDIFRSSGQDVMQRAFDRNATRENFVDGRFGFGDRQLKMSSRLNDSSTRYMSRSVSALATAKEGTEYGSGFDIDHDASKVLSDARSQVREKSFNAWEPLAILSRDTNILEQGFITLGELQTMNEDYPWDEVKVFFLDKNVRDVSNSTGWGGKDNTTIAANIIARGLPSYMTFHQIGAIEFEANNLGYGGETVVLTSNAMSLFGADYDERALQSLEQRLMTELFVEMLPDEDCRFDLRVRADLNLDIHMTIQIGDEEEGHFTFPIFCDSMVPPVMSNNNDDVIGVAETITRIVDSFGTTNNEYRDEPIGLIDVNSKRANF